MDPLKLLSRSTRKTHHSKSARDAPSGGQGAHSQLFQGRTTTTGNHSKKRKRNGEAGSGAEVDNVVNFFGRQDEVGGGMNQETTDHEENDFGRQSVNEDARLQRKSTTTEMPYEACRRILKEHKLRVTWLNRPQLRKSGRGGARKDSTGSTKARDTLVPRPLLSFDELGSRHDVGKQLINNVADQGYTTPTEVQLAALPLLLDEDLHFLPSPTADDQTEHIRNDGIDLLTVAPTGSGKTLAFMIPLLESLKRQRRKAAGGTRCTSAVILAPTKELAAQIVNEGRKLGQNTGIRVTQMRKGMKFGRASGSNDEVGDGDRVETDEGHASSTLVKADIVVSTPGVLQSALHASGESDSLPYVRHLVLDEADVLLDPLFKDQTLGIWHSLTHRQLRVSLWSATMGSNVEELARSTIAARLRQLQAAANVQAAEAPLIRLIVGLKDSAAPNVEHKLLYAASEQGKLMGLRQLLHPTSSSHEAGPMLRPPFLVFTQTIERAIALHSELRYDIPAEAGGLSRIAVLHADLSAAARDDVMTRFRKGMIWVLITTDLLSRGVDFRGVNGVVNYDIPGSSAAYIHRIGRTGRAGREGGVAVTLYSKEDMPYLKHIANVMAMAQRQRGEEASDMQKWLLDALPKLSKNEKQALRKHGVKSRTSKGQGIDAIASRRTKISTKAGFDRRAETRRKGAKAANQRVSDSESDSDAGNETDFAGFD